MKTNCKSDFEIYLNIFITYIKCGFASCVESYTKNLTLKSKQERNQWEEDFQNDIINPVIMVLLAELLY